MIVDLHTRIWDTLHDLGEPIASAARRRRAEPWNALSATPELHSAAMQPVTYAAVLGFESALLNASLDAEHVAKAVATNPLKLVGFVGIDPTFGKPVAKLEKALAMGLAGVVVSPAAAGFHPSDTRAMALFEACQDRGVPVLIECGATVAQQVKLEFAQPYLLDEVARSFPELKLVLSSFGQPWIDQGVTMMAKHPNVFADVSGLMLRTWQLYNAMVHAYQAQVMSQVLFGSGFPFSDPQQAIVTLYSVNTTSQGTPLPTVPREQLRSVVERDTLATLGIIKPDAGKRALPPGPGSSPGNPADKAGGASFERVVTNEAAR